MLAFTLTIILLSAAFSGLLTPVVNLPWWKVFRRCASVSAAAALWLMMRAQRQPLRSLGLGPWATGRRWVLRGALLSLGAAGLLQGLYLLAGMSAYALHPEHARVARIVITFVPAAGLVAVLEELIFRGYVFQQLRTCSQRLAVWGSSLAYAVIHLRPNPVWPQSGFELIGLAVLGWVLARSVLQTNQLYLAIGLHAGFAYWARTSKFFFEMTAPSLAWLTGSTRLINGVGAWCALAGIAWWISRQRRGSA